MNRDLDISEELTEKFEQVLSDKDILSWIWIGYASDHEPKLIGLRSKPKLVVVSEGSSSFNEFVQDLEKEGRETQILYGYIRVNMLKDNFATGRYRFVFVVWIPSSVSPLKRACTSIHTGLVKGKIRNLSIDVAASCISDLQMDDIQTQLKRAAGADYDRQVSSY